MKLLFCAVVLLSLAPSISGQQSSRASRDTVGRIDREQIVTLRAQLDVMKEFDQKILDTAFWAIGVACTMVTLLVGFSWFANWKMYDRDKAALTQELKSSLQQQVSDAKEALEEQSTKRYEQIATMARAAGETAASELKAEVDRNMMRLDTHIGDLRYDMLGSEARRWTSARTYSNALREYMLMLSLAKVQQADWRISRALGALDDVLDKIINESTSRPDVELASQLVAILDQLPASYSLEVSRLKTKLATARG